MRRFLTYALLPSTALLWSCCTCTTGAAPPTAPSQPSPAAPTAVVEGNSRSKDKESRRPEVTPSEPTRASSWLDVRIAAQETRMWCWSASAQMIMDYLGHHVPQCTQANDTFGLTDCPCHQCDAQRNPNPNLTCIQGGFPRFCAYQFHALRKHEPLTWKELKQELSDEPGFKKTPIAFIWKWLGGGGHVMVARGYREENGVRYVETLDPLSVCKGGDVQTVTYEEFVKGEHHTHWDDFYDIRHDGSVTCDSELQQ
jgi:hypothetical protein